MSQPFGMKTYMKGAALLTISALIVKILSAVYRIPFQNIVGDEGFYIYQQVYPFIAIFVVWTTGGVAVAISKLLADNDAEASAYIRAQKRNTIMVIVTGYLLIIACLFFIILYFGAVPIALIMGDIELAPLLKTGSFIVFIMPLFATLKGAFQSRGMMAPIAYAQVVEQVVRVGIILLGTVIVMRYTASLYAAGHIAVLGTVIGEAVGLVLLLLWYWRQFGYQHLFYRMPIMPVIKQVTLLSLSVSMSSLLLLSYQFVDSFTIFTSLLHAGMDMQLAKELKGVFDRGQPLVQLGIVVASSLTLAIVPLIAHQMKSQSEGGRSAQPFIELTYRTALVFGSAAALGLFLVMPNLNMMLFKTDVASDVLAFYMLQIIPLSLVLTFTGILQGMHKLKMPAIILSVGFLIKAVLNVMLVPIFSIMGAAIASNVGLFITAIWLMLYSRRFINMHIPLYFYRQLLLSLVMMALVVCLVQGGIQAQETRKNAALVGLLAIGLGAFTFITSIAKLKLLSEKEWFLLPFGRRMARYQLWLNQKK